MSTLWRSEPPGVGTLGKNVFDVAVSTVCGRLGDVGDHRDVVVVGRDDESDRFAVGSGRDPPPGARAAVAGEFRLVVVAGGGRGGHPGEVVAAVRYQALVVRPADQGVPDGDIE
jgi:hypothetical protein